VDDGRIVAGGDNEVLVMSTAGERMLSLSVRASAARLSGRDLVVVVRGALLHHDAASGQLLHEWPLPDVPSGQRCATPNIHRCSDPRLMLEGAANGLVTYVADKRVHLLRLTDGSDVVVGQGQAAGFVDSGLVYADGPRLRLVRFEALPIR
jgi:hypothetical protein